MDGQFSEFNLKYIKRGREMSMAHFRSKFECIRTFWCQQKSDYEVVRTPEFPCAQVAPRMGRAPADCHSTIFSDEDLGEAS